MKLHHDTRFFLALLIGNRFLVVSVADERENCAVCAGSRLDDVWNEAVFGFVIKVRKILAATGVFGVALGILFNNQLLAFPHDLAFHMRA